MSAKEFNSELRRREKIQKETMNDTFTKSKSKAEKIAKMELAEKAFNDHAKMLAYKQSVDNLLNKYGKTRIEEPNDAVKKEMVNDIKSKVLSSQKDIDNYKKAYSDENYYYSKRYWASSNDKSNTTTEKLKKAAEEKEWQYFDKAKNLARKTLDSEYGSVMSENSREVMAFSIAEKVFAEAQNQALKEDTRDTRQFEREYDERERKRKE